MSSRRYNAFSDLLRREFGCRVQRVPVDAGFTCPNRDGSSGATGCSYCSAAGSGAVGIRRELSVSEQVLAGREAMARRYRARKFLAYFQAFSNTYAPPEELRRCYDAALAVPDVVGLLVGTRPDCLPPEVLDLLAEYARRTWFWLELGLQSAHDATLRRINRGHDAACFVAAVEACHARGIRVSAHVILGLPGEGREEMLATAALLNRLGVAGVKLHHLYVLEGTPLAADYRRGELQLLTREEYLTLVCDFLERLDPAMVIQRLVGDGPRQQILAPAWGTAKMALLDAIDAELERRGTRQGSLY